MVVDGNVPATHWFASMSAAFCKVQGLTFASHEDRASLRGPQHPTEWNTHLRSSWALLKLHPGFFNSARHKQPQEESLHPRKPGDSSDKRATRPWSSSLFRGERSNHEPKRSQIWNFSPWGTVEPWQRDGLLFESVELLLLNQTNMFSRYVCVCELVLMMSLLYRRSDPVRGMNPYQRLHSSTEALARQPWSMPLLQMAIFLVSLTRP